MENNKEDWKLDSLRIDFKTYGEDKGKYIGDIKFSNGENESFKFKLDSDMCKKYIQLISTHIVYSAENLSNRLIKSLGLNK